MRSPQASEVYRGANVIDRQSSSRKGLEMKSPQDFPSCHLPLRTVLKLAIFPLLVLFLVSSATLDAQAPKKVPFPFSPIGINSLPWFVAKETRIPEKHGIDFNPVFIGSSAVLFQSMLSGAADFAGSGGPAVIANVLRGGDIIQITAMVPRFTQSVMVKPEIKKPEDMAGKKIGVSRLGTATISLCKRRSTATA
jgi:ABC-type nitrate/sulfonate/bicarbonate transport system substrate-binding protein